MKRMSCRLEFLIIERVMQLFDPWLFGFIPINSHHGVPHDGNGVTIGANGDTGQADRDAPARNSRAMTGVIVRDGIRKIAVRMSWDRATRVGSVRVLMVRAECTIRAHEL